jgi:molybdenum cofactor synthesis domain-containing protein
MTEGGPIRAGVLTVSDRCSRGEAEDTSGPAVASVLRDELAAEVAVSECVPDEADRISAVFLEWSRAGIDLIVSTGGTGLGLRDVTPEAAKRILEREHPGLMELARLRCGGGTTVLHPRVYLSRGVAGTVGRSLVVTLPGSRAGAVGMLEALLDVLPHAVTLARGDPGKAAGHDR